MWCAFVNNHQVNSYLKLQVLLRISRSSQQGMSLDELAEQIFVADLGALEQLLGELCQQGVLRCDAQRWALHDRPEVASCLACLERTFADPLARQHLLRQISASRPAGAR